MALTFDGVTLDLGKRRVLEDIGLSIEPGHVTVILGPNGAGKTSLLGAAAGLVAVTGRVAIDDAEVAAMRPRVRARAIGYLSQQGDVAWNMLSGDVVRLGRLPHAAGASADADAIDAAMAATDTAGFAERRIGELSGGERARVLLARVLAGEPDWLLADEPLANLDPAHQFDALAMFRAAADRGVGVVLVLHDLSHAARIADNVVLLKDGRVLAAGDGTSVLTADNLERVFSIRIAHVSTPQGQPIIVPIARMT